MQLDLPMSNMRGLFSEQMYNEVSSASSRRASRRRGVPTPFNLHEVKEGMAGKRQEEASLTPDFPNRKKKRVHCFNVSIKEEPNLEPTPVKAEPVEEEEKKEGSASSSSSRSWSPSDRDSEQRDSESGSVSASPSSSPAQSQSRSSGGSSKRRRKAPVAKSVKGEPQDRTESDWSSSGSECDCGDTILWSQRKKKGLIRCKICRQGFKTSQALGGHMSRKHPGESKDYNYKKSVRKKREFDRSKLLLAKIKFFKGLGRNYEQMMVTDEGKEQVRRLLNRSRLKKIKWALTDKEVNDFVYERSGQMSPDGR